jgi:hypothetical protein
MSKKVQYPNGYIGIASDNAAKILGKKKDHKVIGDAKPAEKPAADKDQDKE